MSHVICEQQRRRSACASAQSDQRLCCSLPTFYNTSSFYIRNFKPLSSFCGSTGRFESTLVGNPEDRFSRDEAHINQLFLPLARWSQRWTGQEKNILPRSKVRLNMSRLITKPTKLVCAQRRLRSAWASAQSDQSLRCPQEESLGP